MKRCLSLLAACALGALGCPSTPAQDGCTSSEECSPGRCVVVHQVGHCEGATASPGDEGEGEGEGVGPPGEGEGDGDGAPAGEGEGDGNGDGAVDTTPRLVRGAFVGGARAAASAHFRLTGALSSTRRR